MRTLSLFALLALAAPAWAQAPTVRLGADMVAGYLSDDLSLGMAGVVLARTPGAVAGYVALRPEATVATIGGTGYYDDLDVYAYGLDGQPLYNGSTCRSVIDDEPSPGSCGANVLSVALDAEVGSRLAVGGGRGAPGRRAASGCRLRGLRRRYGPAGESRLRPPGGGNGSHDDWPRARPLLGLVPWPRVRAARPRPRFIGAASGADRWVAGGDGADPLHPRGRPLRLAGVARCVGP